METTLLFDLKSVPLLHVSIDCTRIYAYVQ